MAMASWVRRWPWCMGQRSSSNAASFTSGRVLAEKCRKDLKGKGKKDERKQFLEQARAVYDAESAQEARTRLAQLSTTWRERAPQAVATLERDG